MAYFKKKKRYHVETPAERAWIDEKLNVYKKFYKPYKGEIVYKREGSSQEFLRKAKYSTKEELLEDADKLVKEMSALDPSHKWKVVSARLVGQTIDDEDAV